MLVAAHLGYELVYVYSDLSLDVSTTSKFLLNDVGGQITFSKNLTSHQCQCFADPSGIEPYIANTLCPDILRLAYLSGHLSRFRVDKNLPLSSFQNMYKLWVQNSLSLRPQHDVFTVFRNEKHIALLTAEFVNNSTCKIGLLAVDPKFHGQGIASKLLQYLEYISKCVTSTKSK